MRFGDAALNTGKKPEPATTSSAGPLAAPIVKNKAFFFVSYEGTRDHRVVDRTVTVPTAGDAAGRSVRSQTRRFTIRSPAMRTAPGARSSRCFPATRTTRCATPQRTRSASTSFPRHGWIRSRRRSRATFPPTTSTGRAATTSPRRPFESDRRQVDTKVRLQRELQVQPGRYVRPPPFQDVGAHHIR